MRRLDEGGANNPGGKNQHTQEEEVKGDIVTIDQTEPTPAQKGNSLAYAHRRLARERPDLFERVCRGELSANAAMIEAGFRNSCNTACNNFGNGSGMVPCYDVSICNFIRCAVHVVHTRTGY
jgi:hypothetical protein